MRMKWDSTGGVNPHLVLLPFPGPQRHGEGTRLGWGGAPLTLVAVPGQDICM